MSPNTKKQILAASILFGLAAAAPSASPLSKRGNNYGYANNGGDYSKATQSGFIPWSNGKQSFKWFPGINVKFEDDKNFEYLAVSTGNSIMMASANHIKEGFDGIRAQGPCNGHYYFVNNDLLSSGRWIKKKLTFKGQNGQDICATADMLAVTEQVYCPGFDHTTDGHSCPEAKRKAGTYQTKPNMKFLGIGFGPQYGTGDGQPSKPRNFFLNIESIGGQPIRPNCYNEGWVMNSTGITVGLTTANTQGYKFAKLDAGNCGQMDWKRIKGTHNIGNTGVIEGTTLINTGFSQGLVEVPTGYNYPKNSDNSICAGTTIDVRVGPAENPIAQYSFKVGSNDPIAPISDSTGKPAVIKPIGPLHDGVCDFDTGVHFMTRYSTAFDAKQGYFGACETNPPSYGA